MDQINDVQKSSFLSDFLWAFFLFIAFSLFFFILLVEATRYTWSFFITVDLLYLGYIVFSILFALKMAVDNQKSSVQEES